MNARKLWVEYLMTANKLYGSFHLAMYNLTLLVIVVFLAAMVISMSSVIFNGVYHIAPADSGFIIISILQPIFNIVIVFQALTILIGFLVSHLDCVVRVE